MRYLQAGFALAAFAFMSSQAHASANSCAFSTAEGSVTASSGSGVFEIDDFSFDTEQTLNIGSQSTGAGSGKITFNPFTITRKTDSASPQLFIMALKQQAITSVTCSLFGKDAGRAPDAPSTVTLRLADATIVKFEVHTTDGQPKEQLTLVFTKLEYSYKP
jgi:type VI protein secretion system component Hcp